MRPQESERRPARSTTDLRIESFMTANPWSVRPGDSILTARRLMSEHGIRHLPVVEDGRVAGVVSNRDLGLAEALLLEDSRETKVADVMSTDVYAVDPRANLGQVAKSMAENKLGSAIVVEQGSVVGIFTTVDALNALAQAVRGFSDERGD